MTAMAGELARITPERVQVELSKLLLGTPAPRDRAARRHRPAEIVLPEVPAMRLAIDSTCSTKDVYRIRWS